jgi:uncharacterized membrane protein
MTLALTWYDWFKALHVIAASVWAGGGVTLFALGTAASRLRDPEKQLTLLRLSNVIGGPMFGISALVLLGFGIGLVENGNWGYDRFFVQWGIGAFAVSSLIGVLFYGAQTKKIEAAAERGLNDPEFQLRVRRYSRVGTLDMLLLMATMFVMTAKPFL